MKMYSHLIILQKIVFFSFYLSKIIQELRAFKLKEKTRTTLGIYKQIFFIPFSITCAYVATRMLVL